MYVYRTNSFDRELKKYQELSSRFAHFCSRLKESNLDEAQERFDRIHSYLKRKEGNFRLIAKIIKVENEPIICFLKLYNRGDAEYNRFLDFVKNKQDLFQESNLTSSLRDWLRKQTINRTPLNIEGTILKSDLRIWLQRPDWKVEAEEITIHESELWSQKFARSEIRSQALVYHQIIEDLIGQISNINTVGVETNWSNIYLYGRENFYIIYSNLETKDDPQERVLLLIAPILGIPEKQKIDELVEPLVDPNIDSNWWEKRHNLLLDDLITYTRRSYPGYLVLDREFWLRIQDGNGVNLTLSNEEKSLLNSVSTEESLPLFLNGRAGSGKSTMLFYLFAYYCYLHLQFCRQNNKDILAKPHPLFITYSPSLSDFAKVKVQSLLKHHHHFLSETNDPDKLPDLGSFFKSLRSFLLKLLPPSERIKFTQENYVSFHRFRELVSDRYQKVSPEKCWLVIQNFIKGYELIDNDTYLDTTAKYQKIPQKEQTVTALEFTEIKENVWDWYHKYTQKYQLWDDRDLVRIILDRSYYKSEYTVIFCDEAQDFTRLELQLILKLSVFSLYNLERETIFSLPFAFAGDPLQTLNPTGFRWASFKAAFYDEVLTPLKLLKKPQVALKLRQLEYNYRSAAAIVKVNNLIQLWRKILFDLTDIEPQKAKKYNNFIPQKFIIGQNIALEHLRNSLSDTIILIPCDEGAEKEFILQDDLLKSFYREANVETPWNILSAISAKGLEFKQVILYRFGEACSLNLAVPNFVASEEDKYFLNKLYVAASRATEKLFIVDSLEGEIKLWSYSSDRACVDRFLSQLKENITQQKWQENVELITAGKSLADLSNNNLEADALTFETVGISTENTNLLNRAIAAYNKSQNKQKANFCLAWKLKLNRDYLAAGNLFLTLNKVAESWLCFWQGSVWHQLQQLIENKPKDLVPRQILLAPLIDFMVDEPQETEGQIDRQLISNLIEVTKFLAAELQQNKLTEEKDSQPWQTFLTTYCDRIQELLSSSLIRSKDYWLKVANILIHYLEEKTDWHKQLIARCFYFGGNYHRATQYWEDLEDDSVNLSQIEPKYYYLAKAKLSKLPEGLNYLYQGRQYQLIIKQWLRLGTPLDLQWLEYVALSFEAIEQYQYALTIYCRLDRYDKVKQCWHKVKHKPLSFSQIVLVINYYLKRQNWSESLELIKEKIKIPNLKYYFTYRLASSQLTPNKLTKQQRHNYQNFIDRHILNNSQWQQYLAVEHLGIALEKIGSFSTTLNFYERYVDCDLQQLRKFSRDRWIATKQRQVSYFRQGANLAKLQKSLQKLTLQSQKWHLNPGKISPQLLTLNSDKLANKFPASPPQKKQSQMRQASFPLSGSPSSFSITGLPQKTKTKTLANNIRQFQFGYLLLRIAMATQQIAIVNLYNRQATTIDWRKGKIQCNTMIVASSGNQPIYFSDSQGKYKGILWRDLNPRLELKLDNYSTVITIKFSHL